MLSPNKTKYKKQQKGRIKGKASKGHRLTFGNIGLLALSHGWISAQQIEAARIALTRHVKRDGKIWVKIFPDKPITKKPAEVRMGKGKGNTEGWVAVIKPGKILYEIYGVKYNLAKRAMELASSKLSIKTKIITYKEEL